jgi:predicted ATPase
MHGLYTYLEANPSGGNREPRFHELSHGESFLEVVRSRFDGPGLYVLDEPESALSFSGCLGLVGVLHDLVSLGTAQVLLATHSPVLAALPGARLLELDDSGWRETPWADLQIVDHHRRFLSEPMRYLRHVLE